MFSRIRTWHLLVFLGVVLVGLAVYLCRDSLSRLGLSHDGRPTYVLIVLDDFDWDLVADDWSAEPGVVPRFPVLHDLAQQGMVFSNFHSTTPVCGPARASILSGQYAHRHQARVNRPDHPTAHGFAGGFPEYGRNRDFARYFQAGGYQTCFVGKYVHDGFSPDRAAGIKWSDLLPNGWDRFHACLGAKYVDFLAMDSATKLTRAVPARFRTDYEADQVIAMLAEQKQTRKAQMVCWFSLSPHDAEDQESAYPPRLQNEFSDEMPPAFARHAGAAGLKLPGPLKTLPNELSPDQRSMIVEKWRERLRSIKAFDENLGRIREYLAKVDRLKNTVFVITSDHGYRLGDHGHVGKRLPYDRITCVPLLVSGSGVPAGRSQRLLANIDLAPTMIDLALGPQAVLPTDFDGQSFAPLISQPNIAPFRRDEILIECWEAETVWGQRIPGVWTILRGENYGYTEWATGDREYYDLDTDPQQLDNRIDSLTAEQVDDLRQRLRQLRTIKDRPPTVTVQTDSWQKIAQVPQNLNYVPLSISGFADADAGIDSAALELRDTTSNQYWNGEDWQDVPAELPVELMNPGGLVSQWRCPLRIHRPAFPETSASLTPIELAERKVSVVVRVVGLNGQTHSERLHQELQLRPMDPETWILVTDKPENSTSGVQLSGYAHGIRPIRNVRVVVQDKEAKTYWDGQGWVGKYAQFEAAVVATENGGVHWTYTFPGDLKERLHFGARALDDTFNFDKTPAYFEWGANGRDVIEYMNNALPSGSHSPVMGR